MINLYIYFQSKIYIRILFYLIFFIIVTRSETLERLETTIISHGGEVFRVNDIEYKRVATLWNPAIQIWPSLILRPAIYDDVSLSLSTFSSLNIPVRIMGGRHSYGAYCSHQGVVLDSTLLKKIIINWKDETITMQGGVIWDEVYNALNGSDYVIVGGICPTVGVVGFTLGGGYSPFYTRSFGLASDNVLNFTVALYNGSIVTASSQVNSDLYWALRGGGGGNFGFILEMTQRIHRITKSQLPSGQMSFFNITWQNQDLTAVLLNWVTFLKEVIDNDDRVSFDVTVSISNESNTLTMWGTFNGPQRELEPLLNPWLRKFPQPISFTVLNYTQADLNKKVGVWIPFPMKTRQHVVSAMATNIDSAMIDVILEPQSNFSESITRVMHIIYLNNGNKDNDTAWPFSDVSFVLGPTFEWIEVDSDYSAINIAEKWLQRLFNTAAPTKSIVGSYLNYIDPYLQNWESMYYRHHWNRLREIKTKWDPTWYFRFPQGIPPFTQ